MSAFGGKADIVQSCRHPLMTPIGHLVVSCPFEPLRIIPERKPKADIDCLLLQCTANLSPKEPEGLIFLMRLRPPKESRSLRRAASKFGMLFPMPRILPSKIGGTGPFEISGCALCTLRTLGFSQTHR